MPERDRTYTENDDQSRGGKLDHATQHKNQRDPTAAQIGSPLERGRPEDRNDLFLLERCVRAAGAIALGYFGGDYRKWSKTGGSPVTEADLAVDAFLKEALLQVRQNYGWLSEESDDNVDRLTSERTFVVDPIDGTVAFLKARPHFTICAAVVQDGRPRAGAVYNPATDECFLAAKDCGAYLNGAPIHPAARDDLADCSMLGDKNLLADPCWPPMQVTSFSSIAYRIVLVASGRYDAALALTAKRDWDLAAADLILTEAGGCFTDAAGRIMIYNRAAATQRTTVAAGPALHACLLAQLARYATKYGLDRHADSA